MAVATSIYDARETKRSFGSEKDAKYMMSVQGLILPSLNNYYQLS